MPQAYEINFDGLIGPTHNYAGLAYGNVASLKNKAVVAHPKQAALQGLEKMRFLMELGLKQAVLPPQERPDLHFLRRIGFSGDDAKILQRVSIEAPQLLAMASSASSMWAANAATVSPSADTVDGKVHFTPANLISLLHRSLEAKTTGRLLKAIFADPNHFVHHAPLPSHRVFGDEGAANHLRLAKSYGEPGVEFFVFGKSIFDKTSSQPKNFPARQTKEASLAIARTHGLNPLRTVFAQQNSVAIDAGAFHNDVVAVGNLNTLFFHEAAFFSPGTSLDELRTCFRQTTNTDLVTVEVKSSEVSLADAVSSYLFNTQLVTLPNGNCALIAPMECRESPTVKAYLDKLLTLTTHTIRSVHYVDVRQSMQNGGGPACLRLRVILTEAEMVKTNPAVFLDAPLYQKLKTWIEKHYRDTLHSDELADPQLISESRRALDELTHILKLGLVYEFQF